nr:LacI family DNA-binding transcriptional regulator [uncultured Gemmiger sp.]
MANQTVTLKQIAQQAGVSITTVHRVLNNKEGCGEELKRKILEIAKREGYTCNVAASSMSKHTMHIALVFPMHDRQSRFFLQPMLDGYLNHRPEFAKFNLLFQEYYYVNMCGTEEEGAVTPLACLRQIYREQPVRFDGVVLYDIDPTQAEKDMLNRLLGRGTVVIMLERAPADIDGLCCVSPDERAAGRLAAELIAKMLRRCPGGTVAVLQQPLSMGDSNGQAFAEELERRFAENTGFRVRRLNCAFVGDMSGQIQEQLAQIPDLVAVYATSARHTAAYLEIQDNLPGKSRIAVGSELFEESYEALHAGILDAVIDKRPYTIGHRALEQAFDGVVRGVPLPPERRILPRILLQGNADAYYKGEKENYDRDSQIE